MPNIYYCDCPQICQTRKQVPHRTYYNHAKYRTNTALTVNFDEYLIQYGDQLSEVNFNLNLPLFLFSPQVQPSGSHVPGDMTDATRPSGGSEGAGSSDSVPHSVTHPGERDVDPWQYCNDSPPMDQYNGHGSDGALHLDNEPTGGNEDQDIEGLNLRNNIPSVCFFLLSDDKLMLNILVYRMTMILGVCMMSNDWTTWIYLPLYKIKQMI
jgi:hypothetical protein